MQIITEKEGKKLVLGTAEAAAKDIGLLGNTCARDILRVILEAPAYPKEIARKLKRHEQLVYYYIRQLEEAKIIAVVKTERLQGTVAKYYAPTAQSFFTKIGDFEESSKAYHSESSFLEPFIHDGELDALIVVGSPDPHGPNKARSRDGYFGMDLALFLGTFLQNIKESAVKLDTEVHEKELGDHNLIILGGPVVNSIAEIINKKSPIRFDEEKKGILSEPSGKVYVHDEVGLISKFPNPFNKQRKVLYIAGIRNSGTKAAIMTFIKKFKDLEKGNTNDKKVAAKVVEGIDLNSDGVVDDVEVLE